jgi:DNA polymerase II small subunit/DNA polymerase delta subunit B
MDLNHFLVTAKIRSQINTRYNKQKETVSQKYDITKLKNSVVMKQYGDKLKIELQNTEVANETDNDNWAVRTQIIA